MTLRELRRARGMSLETLARRAGVALSALSYWEHGKRQPRYPYIQRLAQALGVPPEIVAMAAYESMAAARKAEERQEKEEKKDD